MNFLEVVLFALTEYEPVASSEKLNDINFIQVSLKIFLLLDD